MAATSSKHLQHDSSVILPTNEEITQISSTQSANHGLEIPAVTLDHLVVEETAASPMRSKTRVYTIVTALYVSLFLAALDQTVIATAIPTIADNLQSASGYTWIGGAYLLASAASAPVWAKLSDIWGRKPILLAVVALFFGSSILCALSVSMSMLIAGRAIQGVAGGGITQMVAIIISDIFSMRQRTIIFGGMEFVWALASGVGPILGGAFAQKLSWRWIWWINLPLSGAAFLLLLLSLNVHNPRTKLADGLKALDWAGTLSIVGLTLMVLLGLEFGGQTFPWNSPKVICLLVFGALMSLVFIWSEKKLAKYPLMPLKLFGNRSNLGCLAVDSAFAFVFVASTFYIPLYLQSVKGASPLRAGVLVVPLVILASVSGMVTGVIIHRTGRYVELIWAGTLSMALATGLYILFDADSSIALIVGLECIGGVAAGLLFQPPLIALQANVLQDDIATATATYGFVRELSSAISIVVGGVLFQNGMTLRQPDVRAAGASMEVLQRLTGADAAANAMLIKTIADKGVQQAVKEAFAWSLRNLWIMYTGVAFLGVVGTFFISHRTLSEEHIETRTGLLEEKE